MRRYGFCAAALLLLPVLAWASDEPEAIRGLQFQTKDLVYTVQGLVYTVQDVGGKVQDIGGKVQDVGGRVQDLGGKVQDIKMKETATDIRIELAADVLFDFDKADILPKAQEALKQTAAVIREKARGTVRIEGHTDSKGSDAYNQKLSERRATSVKAWLILKEGLKTVPFTTQGLGARKPVAPNTKPDGSDDPDGRQKNRRVEIIIQKKG